MSVRTQEHANINTSAVSVSYYSSLVYSTGAGTDTAAHSWQQFTHARRRRLLLPIMQTVRPPQTDHRQP